MYFNKTILQKVWSTHYKYLLIIRKVDDKMAEYSKELVVVNTGIQTSGVSCIRASHSDKTDETLPAYESSESERIEEPVGWLANKE